ncbi:transglycosylase domain-containing protein [Pseudomonas sp. BMS12]|uniref:transglycosylase domain-containing protein n=1 Tax=Pseudomonas sp. BMS12 TaxID=1796033 RepID=UPI0009EF50CE|nr:transglycosylase domain-containing protein [Pseudomonas sp. BMS12]
MKLLWRLLIHTTIAALALPVIAVLIFDIFWIIPRIEHVKNLAETGSIEERAPAPLITRMVIASEPNGLNWQVARILISQSEPPFKPHGNLQWHLVGVTTSFLLKVHLSEQELVSIYCSRIYVGNKSYGLNHAAHKLFGKSLSQLNTNEAATVAAWPKAPNYFEKNQASLQRNRDRILNNLAGGI